MMNIRQGLVIIDATDLYAGDCTDCTECDLIIITAERGRKPGEAGLDLKKEKVKITKIVEDFIK
ncbi:hypothetical protein MCG98_10120 [Ruminococcus sp. OA3]|nr:hypothetical protein [Ruminococcus sp. OA3]